MDRHFACTACGRCCVGVLPLTLGEAIAHAGRFPLALLVTPLRPGHRGYDRAARLGAVIRFDRRRQVAVQVAPVSCLPPRLECPALTPAGLCALQDDKPLRCRAMPFSPWLDAADQGGLLVPRTGWACDVSAAAPVVYRNRTILDPADVDAEEQALRRQAPVLRGHVEALAATVPGVADKLIAAAAKPVGGDLLIGFGSLLRRLAEADRAEVARRQIPVLVEALARVADDPGVATFRRHYEDGLRECERLARI